MRIVESLHQFLESFQVLVLLFHDVHLVRVYRRLRSAGLRRRLLTDLGSEVLLGGACVLVGADERQTRLHLRVVGGSFLTETREGLPFLHCGHHFVGWSLRVGAVELQGGQHGLQVLHVLRLVGGQLQVANGLHLGQRVRGRVQLSEHLRLVQIGLHHLVGVLSACSGPPFQILIRPLHTGYEYYLVLNVLHVVVGVPSRLEIGQVSAERPLGETVPGRIDLLLGQHLCFGGDCLECLELCLHWLHGCVAVQVRGRVLAQLRAAA